jgi:hypothetical protein
MVVCYRRFGTDFTQRVMVVFFTDVSGPTVCLETSDYSTLCKIQKDHMSQKYSYLVSVLFNCFVSGMKVYVARNGWKWRF